MRNIGASRNTLPASPARPTLQARVKSGLSPGGIPRTSQIVRPYSNRAQLCLFGTPCTDKNLVSFFGDDAHLDHVSTARIEQFKQKRRTDKVTTATINRDLRFLAQILKQAERERCLARSPFDLTKFFLNESRDRRKPHILTWEEQTKLLAVASPRLRVLIFLGVETGMRTGEMLKLRWMDIDSLNDVIQVGRSKTLAGMRAVPISAHCKAELLRWRNLI